MISKAARRYASAFLHTAIEIDKLELIKQDMLFLVETLSGSRDLELFLKSPIIKRSDKAEVLKSIFDEHIQKETRQFLSLLVSKGREDLISQICSSFVNKYNLHQGIINIDVFTATDLVGDQKESLISTLETSTGKKVQLNTFVDKNLIGGIAVKIDDTVVDGTIKHKLSQLKNQFAATAAE